MLIRLELISSFFHKDAPKGFFTHFCSLATHGSIMTTRAHKFTLTYGTTQTCYSLHHLRKYMGAGR